MSKDNQILNFKNNPYQYTRAVRFRGEPQRQSECFEQDRTKRDESKDNLPELTELLSKTYKDITGLFYVKTKDGQLSFRNKLLVNKTWLRQWHKDIFHLLLKQPKNKQGKYSLQELKDLHKNFDKFFDEWKGHTDQLKEAVEKPSHSQVRRSDIASAISGLLNRTKLDYISDLLRETHAKNAGLDKKIEDLKKILQNVKEKLQEAEGYYLPSQSSGVEIAKASFNYHTVNKKPKEYEKELKKAECEKDKESFTTIKMNKAGYFWKDIRNNGKEIFTFKSRLEKEWIKRYIETNNLQGNFEEGIALSLDQTYSAMKAFKAEQKSIFYEVMTHIASELNSSYEVKNQNHYLNGYEIDYRKLNMEGINEIYSLFVFKDTEGYEKFIYLTKNVKESNNKEIRGKFLFGNKCYFKKYSNFCEQYRNIAQRRGRLIAQIKGIEKEKQDAEQTGYWSLLYVENDNKQLWLIPKNMMQEAREFYESKGKNYKTGDPKYLCCFESLTMRALRKLCFAEQSSFVNAMPPELQTLQKNAKELKTEGEEQKLEQKRQKQFELYKKLLRSDYAKETLKLENFDLAAALTAKNLKEFEQSLEDVCYHINRISFNKDEKLSFLKKFDVTVLEINSYDLEGRNKTSENRYHTELWKAFWDGFDNPSKKTKQVKGFELGKIRLNPEVKVRYRKTDPELKEYFKKKQFDPSFKHRRLKDQFTVNFTLALNAGKKYDELAFSKPEEILEKINDFNNRLNKEMDFKKAWKYGIDRGNIELATLCLAKFDPDNETYEENGKKFVKPSFPNGDEDIKCYALKNHNHSEQYTTKQGETKLRKAVHNLSYFINNESLFDTKTVSCLDLTTAKVIKGKIVTNGDVMTYLKLKKTAAKRRLYDLYCKNEIAEGAKLEWDTKENGKGAEERPEGVLNIQTRGGEITIYWYLKKYNEILSKESIEKDLNRYLIELLTTSDNSHTPSVVQINNLRDAITANMVGVICHLQKTYPGFVILEDLGQTNITKHFSQHNENIARRLEKHLYNKFQSLGLVPPHVKDVIRLREDIREKQQKKEEQQKITKSSQIGTIIFVDEADTSKNCPYCEVKQTPGEKREFEKFHQHRFICGDTSPCGFDTYYFKNENDRVPNYKPEIDTDSYKDEFDLFKEIDDPDKVASYNIAKKIKNPEEIGKMEILSKKPSKQQSKTKSSNIKQTSKHKSKNEKESDPEAGFKHTPFKDFLGNKLKK